jgi:glutathione S-transferase
MVLPRPDLEALGITYRRIPLLAVGKDIYADSSRIIELIVKDLAKSGAVPTAPTDKPYEDWGNVVFGESLGLISPSRLSPAFVNDRKTIFPLIERPDFESLRPSAVAAFQSRLKQVEEVFLTNSNGPFIGGEKLSMADIHVIWSIRW